MSKYAERHDETMRPQVGTLAVHSVRTVPVMAGDSGTVGQYIDSVLNTARDTGEVVTRLDLRLGDDD